MSNCELLETCIFFNDKMEEYPAGVAAMRRRYCLKDNSCCARYQVFKELGREKVPADLFPNDKSRAQLIIS
ncbi:MAG: hypothetical protein D6B28_08340 [Gammaproteobacteria bacterium]|nr:MAG: hypothetical protein D6B28_08340 [Gammaproteobacteria bacterium]